MYKFTNATTIKRLADNAFIPVNEGNVDYQLFVKDVIDKGTSIVEGVDLER